MLNVPALSNSPSVCFLSWPVGIKDLVDLGGGVQWVRGQLEEANRPEETKYRNRVLKRETKRIISENEGWQGVSDLKDLIVDVRADRDKVNKCERMGEIESVGTAFRS